VGEGVEFICGCGPLGRGNALMLYRRGVLQGGMNSLIEVKAAFTGQYPYWCEFAVAGGSTSPETLFDNVLNLVGYNLVTQRIGLWIVVRTEVTDVYTLFVFAVSGGSFRSRTTLIDNLCSKTDRTVNIRNTGTEFGMSFTVGNGAFYIKTASSDIVQANRANDITPLPESRKAEIERAFAALYPVYTRFSIKEGIAYSTKATRQTPTAFEQILNLIGYDRSQRAVGIWSVVPDRNNVHYLKKFAMITHSSIDLINAINSIRKTSSPVSITCDSDGFFTLVVAGQPPFYFREGVSKALTARYQLASTLARICQLMTLANPSQ
jgi:hypothetical protein